MKAKIMIMAAAALALSACADLGFGVDLDSGGASPYFYGSDGPFYGGWNGDPYWGMSLPSWGYFPSYRPSRPPLVGNGPGSVWNPNPGPALPPNRPGTGAQRPHQATIPGAGAGTRPGNGGLPTGITLTPANPPSVPQGQPTRGR